MLGYYTSSGTNFVLTDWIGTKRALIAYDGALSSAWCSLPFGNNLTQCGGNGSDPSDIHYMQKERDQETGNDDFGARYYASNMGRWITPDWAAGVEVVPYANFPSPQTLNLYSFVSNNPLSNMDADGHQPSRVLCSDGVAGQCGMGTYPGDASIFSSEGMNSGGSDCGNSSEPGCQPNPIRQTELDFEAIAEAQQQSQTTSNTSTPSDPIVNALQTDVPGVAKVTPTADASFNKGGHKNETDALTFKTPEDQAKFLAEGSRKGLVPGDTSQNGFGPGVRLDGGLHAENARIDPRTGRLTVTSHIDRFNPNNGLGPMVGHAVVDVFIGTVFCHSSACLD